MNNELKKAAEILVECGSATKISKIEHTSYIFIYNNGGMWDEVCPFADTLEGRRQADAIEDWLGDKYTGLVINSKANVSDNVKTRHQYRLDRIKWCLEQLAGKDNE